MTQVQDAFLAALSAPKTRAVPPSPAIQAVNIGNAVSRIAIYPQVVGWLRQQTWSDFAKAMVGEIEAHGGLTRGQLAVVTLMRQKPRARLGLNPGLQAALSGPNEDASAPVETASPVPPMSFANQTAKRPSFADAIDTLVADYVRHGDILWDNETEQYVTQRCRRYRFAS